MNKKMYFEPEMEVVELELQGMLAASPDPDKPGILDGDGDTGDLG
jgi:hypothetical protein